jgi:ribosome-binding factor A
MLSYRRSVRVAEQIQKEVARIIQELTVPGLGFVTVTGVKLTDDLLDARVYYSVMGNTQEVESTKAIIEHSAQNIRHELASRLNLRRTPTLTFSYDDTPERASHVFEILEHIKDENCGIGTKSARPRPARRRVRKPLKQGSRPKRKKKSK